MNSAKRFHFPALVALAFCLGASGCTSVSRAPASGSEAKPARAKRNDRQPAYRPPTGDPNEPLEDPFAAGSGEAARNSSAFLPPVGNANEKFSQILEEGNTGFQLDDEIGRIWIGGPPASPAPTPQPPPSAGGTAIPNDKPYDLTYFEHAGVNPFIDTEDDPLSTFALDVDTASYAVARRYIADGNMPEPASVRVEEFVNAFDQGFEPPEEGPFAIRLDGAPSPFGGEQHWLLRAGVRGKDVPESDRKNASLTFVIDVSGSMNQENRLGLVKKSLRLLVERLRPQERVGIVVYGSQGRVLLSSTSIHQKDKILDAIDELVPEGATNADEGLRLGYQMAANAFQEGWINRVILCSDGVANVGETGAEGILKAIDEQRRKGITLTAIGFGMGNYNDTMMERLANKGDGAYFYVDELPEAKRVLVDNLAGTLQAIGRDAKIQVAFNPEAVSRWRLLGYENRDVADDDFRDDTVDGGEVGAGHSVCALYELKLQPEASPEAAVAKVQLRWLDPDSREPTEIARTFARAEFAETFEGASPRFQLAAVVAEFAEILRKSYWAKESSLEKVAAMARRIAGSLPEDRDATEFAYLAGRAAELP